MAITGFGAANCQMAAFALTELLPNKWRHIGEYSPVNLCVSSSYRYQLNSLQVLLLLTQLCTWQSLSFRLQLVMGRWPLTNMMSTEADLMEQILCWYLERKLLCSSCCPGPVVRGTFDSVLPAKTSFRSAIQPSLSGTRLRRHFPVYCRFVAIPYGDSLGKHLSINRRTRHCSSRCWMRGFGYLRPMGDVRQFETPIDANKHVHLI